MKTHKVTFIIGLLVFITPVIGLPSMIENVVFIAYGIGIMLISSTINFKDFEEQKEKHTEIFSEKNPNSNEEQKIPDFNGQAEEIIDGQNNLTNDNKEKENQE